MSSRRLAIVTSHPIQYQAPWFREIAATPGIDLTVLFAMLPDESQQGDEFGVKFRWDLPLREGYHSEVLTNVSKRPGVMSFSGCDTPAIGNHLTRSRFDAVIVNGWVVKTCVQALRAARRAGIPCFVRGESNVLRPRAWWKSVIHRQLLSRYSGFLYIGKSNRRFYESHGARPDQLFPAHYCVENDRFARAATPEAGQALRARFGISADLPLFLFSGKFIPKKHPLELLEAVGAAVGRGARLHLLMVGTGELLECCQRYAAENRLPVTFAGFLNQSEIPAAYAASDCLALSSDTGETWGLVVNEAMACGRPAIVSNLAGCHEDLIAPGVTGDVFPFGNWKVLAQQLVTYSQDRGRLAQMGLAAQERIVDYSPAAAARGVLAALNSPIVSKALRIRSQPNPHTSTS